MSRPIVDVLYTPYLDDSECSTFMSSKSLFCIIQFWMIMYFCLMCSHGFGVGIKCMYFKSNETRIWKGCLGNSQLCSTLNPQHTQCSLYMPGEKVRWPGYLTTINLRCACAVSRQPCMYLVSPWHFGRHRKKLRGSTVEWEIQVWCGRTSLKGTCTKYRRSFTKS